MHRATACCSKLNIRPNPTFFKFQTILRVWDCFLLEGPKVLFRFVLALLHMHKNTLLECTDTMSILKALKLCAKHTYDVDALVKVRRRLALFSPACSMLFEQCKTALHF
jgi:hypothetical protein